MDIQLGKGVDVELKTDLQDGALEIAVSFEGPDAKPYLLIRPGSDEGVGEANGDLAEIAEVGEGKAWVLLTWDDVERLSELLAAAVKLRKSRPAKKPVKLAPIAPALQPQEQKGDG